MLRTVHAQKREGPVLQGLGYFLSSSHLTECYLDWEIRSGQIVHLHSRVRLGDSLDMNLDFEIRRPQYWSYLSQCVPQGVGRS